MLEFAVAGLPALRGGESGQVRKEAATATAASAGGKARHILPKEMKHFLWENVAGPRSVALPPDLPRRAREAINEPAQGRKKSMEQALLQTPDTPVWSFSS